MRQPGGSPVAAAGARSKPVRYYTSGAVGGRREPAVQSGLVSCPLRCVTGTWRWRTGWWTRQDVLHRRGRSSSSSRRCSSRGCSVPAGSCCSCGMRLQGAEAWSPCAGCWAAGCRCAGAAVVRSGRLEAARFLHEECGVTLQQDGLLRHSARTGSVPLAAWLLQAGCPVSKDAYSGAVAARSMPMLRWLQEVVPHPWGADTLQDILCGWVSKRVGQGGISKKSGSSSSSSSSSRGGGDGGSGSGSSSGGSSGSSDDLERVVRAMLEAGCPPGAGTDRADTIGAAARRGHLPLVRHLHEERGVAFAPGTLATAAAGGCVPVVEWLVGAGCRAGEPKEGEVESNDPYVAAAGGRAGLGIADVATLSCLRRLGVPWNASVLRWAVRKGVSLRVLRWMVEQGAPWDESTRREEVARVKREEVVSPLRRGGCKAMRLWRGLRSGWANMLLCWLRCGGAVRGCGLRMGRTPVWLFRTRTAGLRYVQTGTPIEVSNTGTGMRVP